MLGSEEDRAEGPGQWMLSMVLSRGVIQLAFCPHSAEQGGHLCCGRRPGKVVVSMGDWLQMGGSVCVCKHVCLYCICS